MNFKQYENDESVTMNEKISVIIPLYNKEHEIKRALDSVLSQTFQDFEIIVVDDHSSDKGPAIVKSFSDPRITLIEQEHHGVSYTRNHGVNLATCDYFAFLDADDEWMPKHLETIMRLIEKYPDAGMYTTAHKIHTSEGLTRWANYQYIPNAPWEGLLPDYFRSGALGGYPVNATTVVIPKKIFHEVGGFPEGFGWAEDADLFGKIALKYPVAFSWVFGAIYHWDAENRTCDKSTMTLDFEDEPFIHTAHAALEKKEVPLELIESLNEYIARREIDWACKYIKDEKYEKARALLNHCETRWFYKEKKRLLFHLHFRYPLVLLLMDIMTLFYNVVQKFYPLFKRKYDIQTIRSFIPLQGMSNNTELPRVAIIIVTYNSGSIIKNTLASVLRLNYPLNLLELIVIDNHSEDNVEQVISQFNQENTDKIETKFIKNIRNYGFGKAMNLATQHASADAQYLLLLKPNWQLNEDTLDHLVSSALSTINSGFRLWECRQLPYEHPKYYNPVTLETTWSSAACCLIERRTFREIKGFDENIFLHLEDVDLSWRIRMAGYHLMYVPKAKVFHDSLSAPGTFKVTMRNNSLLYGYYLRYKFGSFWDIIRYSKMFWSLFFSISKNLENERIILISQYLKHFLLIPSAIVYRIKERRALHSFRPLFFNCNFEMHRPGAFVKLGIEECNESSLPKVSIIVRTIGRKGFLREALISIRNQTYPNIEVIVIEDGPATVQELLQSEFKDLEIKYIPLEKNRGRSYAGSYGMEQSKGKYLRFLDEDDLLFAHSVETAVCFMLKNLEKVKLVYDLAYLVPTEVLSEDPFTYKEYGYKVQHDEEFNRTNLLDHNYIPIQCALFDRDLWERYGGFDESLEVLEDWDLWIRYSMKTDFLKIPAVTSLYRYPSDPIAGEKRKRLFDSYESRVKKKHSGYHTMII